MCAFFAKIVFVSAPFFELTARVYFEMPGPSGSGKYGAELQSQPTGHLQPAVGPLRPLA
jgi:hypothetical protein